MKVTFIINAGIFTPVTLLNSYKIITISLVCIVSITIGVYLYFSGKEYQIILTETQLQENLNAKLPLTKKYLFIVEVTLENPRISLSHGEKRVHAGLDVLLNIKINRNPIPLKGSIDVSGGVFYENKTGQFFLKDPIIKNVDITGIPDKYIEKINTALTKALTYYYAHHPIYSLKSSDIKQASVKIVLKDVYVQRKELFIILGI